MKYTKQTKNISVHVGGRRNSHSFIKFYLFEKLPFTINNQYSAYEDSSVSSDRYNSYVLFCAFSRTWLRVSMHIPTSYNAYMHTESNGSRELVTRCKPFISLPLFCSF